MHANMRSLVSQVTTRVKGWHSIRSTLVQGLKGLDSILTCYDNKKSESPFYAEAVIENLQFLTFEIISCAPEN